MDTKLDAVTPVAVDRLTYGIAVTFSNNETVLYSNEFLQDMKHDGRNRTLPDSPEDHPAQ